MTEIAKRPSIRDQEIIKSVARELAVEILKDQCNEDAVSSLVSVLQRNPGGDGYQLAKYLDDDHGWDVDVDTVEILDSAYSSLHVAARKLTAEWVERNAIKPKRKIGDIVGIVQRGINYTGEIVKIDEPQATYTVMSAQCGHVREGLGTHGFIVNYEDIHELAAAPEEFCLDTQGGTKQ